jgi:hypothetical protein
MSNTEKAIKRIKLLKGHFAPSPEFFSELGKSTYNFELAASVVRKLRPEEHYKTCEILDSLSEG